MSVGSFFRTMCCLYALGSASFGQTDRVTQLIAKLGDPAACSNRVQVAEELGWIKDHRAVEPLIAALTDSSAGVRRFAAQALGMIGDRRAVEPLIVALSDESAGVRLEAVEALGSLRDQRAAEPLKAVLNDSLVGRNARSAISEIAHPGLRPILTETFARAPRKIDPNFVWPSTLPQYPGWYGARYSPRVIYSKFNSGLYNRYANALQSTNEGQFKFNAPRGDICDADDATAASVMSFYEANLRASGMSTKRENRGVGPVLGVAAADARRSIIIFPNGTSMLNRASVEPPGLGITIEVQYAPCASVVNGNVVVSAKVSDTNMDAAKIPCHIPNVWHTVNGTWTDPGTNLIWSTKDSGALIPQAGAVAFCNALDLSGFNDWRVPTERELVSIADRTAIWDQYHIRGGIAITGQGTVWSSSDGSKPDQKIAFDFAKGVLKSVSQLSPDGTAVCVRGR